MNVGAELNGVEAPPGPLSAVVAQCLATAVRAAQSRRRVQADMNGDDQPDFIEIGQTDSPGKVYTQ